MIQLSEQQEYLLLGKISDTLTPEESSALEEALQREPTVWQAYTDLINQLPAEKVAASYRHLNENAYWKDLTAGFKQRQHVSTRIILLKSLAAASIILLVAAGGWLFYSQERGKAPDSRTQSAVRMENQPAVQLRLANGKLINLSAKEGEIVTGSAQLSITDKSLSYIATPDGGQGMNSVIVPVGLDYKIVLSDGSLVWLNSATKLDFPLIFSGKTRDISINGEAYLQIAENVDKPFIVHLPGSTVRVTGTGFNVNTYDSGVVKVSLVEGSVDMKAADGEISLSPGQEGVYQRNAGIRQQRFDPKYVLSWRKGLYYFDEATLEDISKVIPRLFGVGVIIDNPAISTKKFVYVIDRNQSIAVFQDDLKAVSGIDSYIDAEGLLHFK